MKKRVALFTLLALVLSFAYAQKETISRIPLLGEDAPAFTAPTTNGTLNFPGDLGKKWKILFSHPADFTPVCSTEILELAQMQNDFDQLGVSLAIISTDLLSRHVAWKKSLEEISYQGQKPVKIKFPLIEDSDRRISNSYGMISPKVNDTKGVRGVYIIDPENKIASINFYPMSVGRNMAEIKRTLLALQTTQKQQVLMPANWNPGDDVLLPYLSDAQRLKVENNPVESDPLLQLDNDVLYPYFDEYRDNNAPQYNTESPDVYSLSWFMFFKKIQ